MRSAEALEILAAAPRRIALLARVNPSNFEAEVARVVALEPGATTDVAFVYASPPPDLSTERRALEAARAVFDREGVRLHRERAEELLLEAQIAEARGTPRFASLAARRFAPSGGAPTLAAADALAARWVDEPPLVAHDASAASSIVTDDATDPRSLLTALRREISALGLPVRVVVTRGLIPLAAAGDGFLQIAAGRTVSELDVARTVLHELEGHVRPMLAARTSPRPIARIGSARGSDTQEGLALHLEARGGFLGGARAIELGLRHVAGRLAHAGANLDDVIATLSSRAERGAAVRAACRAFRGGGLGREVAYVPAYVEIEARLASEPTILDRLRAAGRLSLGALDALDGEPLGREALGSEDR